MGEEGYIRELKEGAIGTKLPTLIDLNPDSVLDNLGRVEVPTSKHLSQKGDIKFDSGSRDETLRSEILREIKMLHDSGKSIDEIYSALERKGYEYRFIEPLLVEFLSGEKSKPSSEQISGQKNEYGGMAHNNKPKAMVKLKDTKKENPPEPNIPKQGHFHFFGHGEKPEKKETSPPENLPKLQKPIPQITALPNPTITIPQSTTLPKAEHPVQPQNIQGLPANQPKAMQELPSGGYAEYEELPTDQLKECPPQQSFAQEGPSSKKPRLESYTESVDNEFAPLFVRVGKYRETLETLHDLQNYLKAMSRLFQIVEDLEKIRVMNISALNKLHGKALETGSRLSAGLIKPRGLHLEGRRETEVELGRLDEVITDLSKELSALKDEVIKLSKIN
jgi:hypothetical protein